MQVTNAEGKVVKDSGIFPNLITNSGLDFIGTCPSAGVSFSISDFTAMCAVGVGNTAPAVTNTTLQSWLAAVYQTSGNGCNVNTSYNVGPPAYWQGQRSFQFTAGTATGNIAEIGIGPSSTQPPVATNPLFSRALVVDGGGHPTVIPVLATEALTVTYILQVYLNLTDTSYSMSLSGTSYTGIFRRSAVTTIPAIGISIGTATNSTTGANYFCAVYSGGIGNTSQFPSGSSSQVAASTTAYVAGSYTAGFTAAFDINAGNFGAGGIPAILWGDVNTSGGFYQMSVSPAIPKTNAYNMTLSCNYSWARYP